MLGEWLMGRDVSYHGTGHSLRSGRSVYIYVFSASIYFILIPPLQHWYNWQIKIKHFKVYNMMIWYVYIVKQLRDQAN